MTPPACVPWGPEKQHDRAMCTGLHVAGGPLGLSRNPSPKSVASPSSLPMCLSSGGGNFAYSNQPQGGLRKETATRSWVKLSCVPFMLDTCFTHGG